MEGNFESDLKLPQIGTVNSFSGKKTESEAFFSFTNFLMPTRVYSLDLSNCQLVILPACNTNLGDIAEGEGVMSLARGLRYAKAKRLISSLWSVNDKSTSELFEILAQNLNSQQSVGLV